ncbi:MAG: multiheme c-type cytochrome, partial [Mariprofundaceae bacterium]|nr:multiheme c-type cytochrome [Mariprofundaceae bacterium]
MKKQYSHALWALSCLFAGLMLIGAASDLPFHYWQQPAASKSNAYQQWSKLERDLRPEACAQCHNDQFQAWKKSLHASAYSEGLIGQFPSLGGHRSGNNCLVCHAPLQEQSYQNNADLMASLTLKIEQPKGVDNDANLDAPRLPLRHSGVNCATCHVRAYKRFGPPRAGSKKTGHIRTDVHGGFTATRAFEKSQFC